MRPQIQRCHESTSAFWSKFCHVFRMFACAELKTKNDLKWLDNDFIYCGAAGFLVWREISPSSVNWAVWTLRIFALCFASPIYSSIGDCKRTFRETPVVNVLQKNNYIVWGAEFWQRSMHRDRRQLQVKLHLCVSSIRISSLGSTTNDRWQISLDIFFNFATRCSPIRGLMPHTCLTLLLWWNTAQKSQLSGTNLGSSVEW